MALDREKTLQSAQRFVDRKKYDKAIEEYQKIVRDDPNDARTLLKIGDLQARMQAYADAIATYDRVGEYYASQGFALKAIAVYKQVRELIRKHAPELADNYAHIIPKLADIYTRLGLPNDALAAYDELASHCQRAGREREAIEAFQKMVDLDTSNPLHHLRLAEACCRIDELDPAIGSFWTAADLLIGMGRPDDALKVIERILHFRQDSRYARAAAELYLAKATREDGLQALAKLQICFQENPKDLDTLGFLAQAFTTIGAEAKAIEVYKEMARVAREQGRYDLFEQLLAHLQTAAPDDEQVRALRSLPPSGESLRVLSSASRSGATIEEADLEIIEEGPAVETQIASEPPPVPRRESRPPVKAPETIVSSESSHPESIGESSSEVREQSRKAMADAESFRKLRLYSKATEALRLALDLDPESLELREKLRQLLEETGDLEGAADEAVTLAEVHLLRKDVERAQELCCEALELVPENVAARQLLARMGATETSPAGWGQCGSRGAEQATRENLAAVALLSSNLKTRGSTPGEEVSPIPPELPRFDGVDDPFSELDRAPLPSFPLVPEENPSPHPPAGPRLPSFADFADPRQVTGHAGDLEGREFHLAGEQPPVRHLGAGCDTAPQADGFPDLQARATTKGAATGDHRASLPDQVVASRPLGGHSARAEGVQEAIEEADFFASRGLYYDARAILSEQLARTPNDRLLVERLQELGQNTAGESGTIDRLLLARLAAQAPAPEPTDEFGGSLDALDLPPRAAAARQALTLDRDQRPGRELIATFREGIRQQVPDSDAATHYDLGVAYKEMGLLDDAIHEFEVAARDADRECNCYAMIGLIGLEQGDLNRAEAAYLRGLEAGQKSVEQEMALYYDLGNVKEMGGQRDEALYYFRRIARRDPGFRDVRERIAALEPVSAQSATRGPAEDDEFDAVFDKLFESS